jgi:hypothetical protein
MIYNDIRCKNALGFIPLHQPLVCHHYWLHLAEMGVRRVWPGDTLEGVCESGLGLNTEQY